MRLKQLLHGERGSSSFAIFIGGFYLIGVLCFFILLTTIAIAIFRYCMYEHYEAQAALRYAVYSAEMQGQTNGQDISTALNAELVAPYFLQSYSKLTETTLTSIPGTASGNMQNPVTVTGLTSINGGQELPNGVITNQSGYLVTLSVPMLPNANSLFNGLIRNVPVTMSCFIPAQPVPGVQNLIQ